MLTQLKVGKVRGTTFYFILINTLSSWPLLSCKQFMWFDTLYPPPCFLQPGKDKTRQGAGESKETYLRLQAWTTRRHSSVRSS